MIKPSSYVHGVCVFMLGLKMHNYTQSHSQEAVTLCRQLDHRAVG